MPVAAMIALIERHFSFGMHIAIRVKYFFVIQIIIGRLIMKKIIPVLASVSMLFAIGSVMGAGSTSSNSMSSSSGTQSFDNLDQNRDGFINWSESSNGRLFGAERDFNTADTNRDGKLNRSEYDSYVQSHSGDSNINSNGSSGSSSSGGSNSQGGNNGMSSGTGPNSSRVMPGGGAD
jgi:hypothetical protein